MAQIYLSICQSTVSLYRLSVYIHFCCMAYTASSTAQQYAISEIAIVPSCENSTLLQSVISIFHCTLGLQLPNCDGRTEIKLITPP